MGAKRMIEMKRAIFDWKFVFDKRGWNLSYYLIIVFISFIKYHMKVQIIFGHLLLSPIKESILYMVSGTSLYLNSFNNMAIVGVSLGIVIAFCVAIGLYSRYRSDCLLQEDRDSSFQDLLIVYINSSPVRRIKAVIKQALVVGVLTLLSELKVLWQAFNTLLSISI
ncbi:hypothetical protein ACJX0J_042402 [Zea mays]